MSKASCIACIYFSLLHVYISVSTMHICNCHLEATALMSLLLSAPHHALMLHSFSGYMECRTGRVTLIHSAITSRAQRYMMLINVVFGVVDTNFSQICAGESSSDRNFQQMSLVVFVPNQCKFRSLDIACSGRSS